MTKITVVMPTFNRANFIGEALDSLGAQTVPALEYIVVDDCSTDGTNDKLQGHPQAARIRYHRNTRNLGASESRNVGVGMARGEVIVFLDSDDILEPTHHEEALAILGAKPEVGLYCCDARMIGPGGELLHGGRTYTEIQCSPRPPLPTGPRSLAQIFLLSTSFPGMTLRRAIYQAVGGLDQGIFPLDDYDLQIKVAGSGSTVFYSARPLARYRVHSSNESGPAKSVVVGIQKLRCLRRAAEDHPGLVGAPAARKHRIGEARRELAISLLRDRKWLNGVWELLRSLVDDPGGLAVLLGIVGRKLRRETH
jgi:glycosyltransferase involved in cell wall biosynthesis